jgi:hypothetical protein
MTQKSKEIKVIRTYENGIKVSEIATCDCNGIDWMDIFIGILAALVALWVMVIQFGNVG